MIVGISVVAVVAVMVAMAGPRRPAETATTASVVVVVAVAAAADQPQPADIWGYMRSSVAGIQSQSGPKSPSESPGIWCEGAC